MSMRVCSADLRSNSETGKHSSQRQACGTIRPYTHCHSCSGTVPICRISLACEQAKSEIEISHILVDRNTVRWIIVA